MPVADAAPEYDFAPLGGYRAQLGESPFLSADGIHIWWVDTIGGVLLRTDLRTADEQIWPLHEQVGFVAEAWDRCIVGMESGLFQFDPATANLIAIPDTAPGIGMRYNDACVDPDGDLWAGSMALDGEAPTGALFHFSALDSRRIIDTGYRRINGLARDAPHRLLASDSHPDIRTIWTMNLQSPNIAASRTTFLTLSEAMGRPDGAFIDGQGRYWVATLEGRTLLHPLADGTAHRTIALPVSLPTKATMDVHGRLYIASKYTTDDALSGRLLVGSPRDPSTQFSMSASGR